MIKVLYYLVSFPLSLVAGAFYLVYLLCDKIVGALDRLHSHWLRRCRRWMGQDAEGRSPETLIAIETKRYNTLIALGADPFHRACDGVMTYGPMTGLYYCGECGISVKDDPDADIRQVVWKQTRQGVLVPLN